MFDEYLCEAQGFRRLDGIPDREQTFARYEALGGRPLHKLLPHFQVLGRGSCCRSSTHDSSICWSATRW